LLVVLIRVRSASPRVIHLNPFPQPLYASPQWTLMETPGDYPQQLNGYDCGVFTCTCADFLSAGKHTNFTQRDVTGMRRLIALRILKNVAD
jgi:Ulp1 family protease